jgi:hypothetical protein
MAELLAPVGGVMGPQFGAMVRVCPAGRAVVCFNRLLTSQGDVPKLLARDQRGFLADISLKQQREPA